MPFPTQAVLDALDGIAYAVDVAGRIEALGAPRWSAFADGNGDSGLADSSSVIGRDLFDFVSGGKVKAAYRFFLDELRRGETDLVLLPYRCDGAGVKREMRMAISPIGERSAPSGFLFQSTVLSEETRPPIGLYDFAALNAYAESRRDLPLIGVCSFCQRVSAGGDDTEAPPAAGSDWTTAEDYYRAGGNSEVRVVHGVCADCGESHLSTLAA